MGVWGLCPQWGPGAKPLVRGSGGLCPPGADKFLANKTYFAMKFAANLPIWSDDIKIGYTCIKLM